MKQMIFLQMEVVSRVLEKSGSQVMDRFWMMQDRSFGSLG